MKSLKKNFKILKRKFAQKIKRNPADMAFYLCHGKGLEIGAMSSPYLFDNSCQLSYADIYDEKELKNIIKHIPIANLYSGKYAKVNFVLQPPRYGFESIPDEYFDFVYSSHSLEHTPNPIWALIDELRIVKPGGIVYAVIPNKNFTYDRMRQTTPIKTLVDKYLNLTFEHSKDEALDVIQNTVDHPLYERNKNRAQEYSEEIIKNREGIHHFHVFDELSTSEMLTYISNKTGAQIVYLSSLNKGDLHFALMKA